MPAFAPPPLSGVRSDAPRDRIHRHRLLRGLARLAVVLGITSPSAIALDTLLDFPGYSRGMITAAWLASAIVCSWWYVIRPIRESARRTEAPDSGRAAASGFRVAALAVCAAVLALGPIAWFSGGSDRVRRYVAAWPAPTGDVFYDVVVSSGDPVVKRGESITLTAYLRKTRPNAVVPETAAVIFRQPGSPVETKLPMAGDDKSAFAFTVPAIATDLEYCIESGPARSRWYTIAAVDPVGVVACHATIAPPAYAGAARPKRAIAALAGIEVLQHSRIEVELQLTRRAHAVQLEWRPTGAPALAPAERISVALDESGTAASVELSPGVDGALKWIFFAEKDVRTELAMGIRVRTDAPPKFARVTGLPSQPRRIRREDSLDIVFAATDDIAVANAFLEYGPADAVDDAPPTRVPIAATGFGTDRAQGGIAFRLPPDAVEGQAFRVRLRACDNRSIPGLDLKPQCATFPQVGWSILRLDSAAAPLAVQEIAASSDAVRRTLDGAAKLLAKAHADVEGHRLDYFDKPKLEQDQSVRLGDDLDAVRAALALFDALAQDTAGNDDLGAIARPARDLAKGGIRAAEVQIKIALTEADAEIRDAAALGAQRALAATLVELDALRKASDRVAAIRLDIEEMNRLAHAQRRLADAAMRTIVPAELVVEQKRLREGLETLLRESEVLRRGELDGAARRKRNCSAELAGLERAHRELDAALARHAAETGRDCLDGLAKQQKDIADRVKKFAERTDLAARIAQTGALEPKSARAAADCLDKEKSLEALTEQEKAARELDRLAEALERAAGDRGDVRKAAQQLARWQDDLLRRVTDGVRQTPRGDSPKDRETWTVEQAAIRDATQNLALPPSPALKKFHEPACDTTAHAAGLSARDPEKSAESMRKAAEALNQLAEKLPTQHQRARDASAEVDKLRRESDALAREFDEIARLSNGADDPEAKRKRAVLAEKRRDLAAKVVALDAPGCERRREMAAVAARRCAEVTAKGPTPMSAAAQSDAARQLDRLKQSLEGETPADDKAARLAKLQRELSESISTTGKPASDDLERFRRAQKEIDTRLLQLHAPEEAKALQDAREASQSAGAALKKSDADPEEIKKLSLLAAAAVQRLADKLNGVASPPFSPAVEEVAGDLPSRRAAKEARDLAVEQRTLRGQLARIIERESKPTPPDKDDPQSELARQTRALSEELSRSDPSGKQLEAVRSMLERAAVAMDRAIRSTANNKPGEAADHRRQANEALAQSRIAMERPGDKPHSDEGDGNGFEAAELARHAAELMVQVETASAQSSTGASIQMAADKMTQAATKLRDEIVGRNLRALQNSLDSR